MSNKQEKIKDNKRVSTMFTTLLSSLVFIPLIIIFIMLLQNLGVDLSFEDSNIVLLAVTIALVGIYVLINSLSWFKYLKTKEKVIIPKIFLGVSIICFVIVTMIALVFANIEVVKLLFFSRGVVPPLHILFPIIIIITMSLVIGLIALFCKKKEKGKLNNKKFAVSIFSLILSVIVVIVPLTFVLGKSQVEIPFLLFLDNTPSDTPVIESIVYDHNKTPEENITQISSIFFENSLKFQSEAPNISHSDNYGNKNFVFYADIEKGMFYSNVYSNTCYRNITYDYYGKDDCIQGDNSYEIPYWLENKVKPINIDYQKRYIDLEYNQVIKRSHLSIIDYDFILNDIENIFGKIKNRDGLKKAIEEHSEIKFSQKEMSNSYFETETGAKIVVMSKITSNSSRLQINCYTVTEVSDDGKLNYLLEYN